MSSLEAVKMHLKGGALGRTFGNEQARARAFEGVRAGTEGGDKNSRCGRDNADEHSAMQEKVQAIQGIRGRGIDTPRARETVQSANRIGRQEPDNRVIQRTLPRLWADAGGGKAGTGGLHDRKGDAEALAD